MSRLLYSLEPWTGMVLGSVFVTGIGGPAGRSTVAHVRQKGFWTIGADMRDVDTPVDAFRLLPPVDDHLFTTELLALIRRERPTLLIPTVSEELPLVARLEKDIEKLGCRVFISPSEAVDIAHNKLLTMRFFENTDVAVPKTAAECSSPETVLRTLGIPCLAKPSVGRGGRGVVVYHSDRELLAEDRRGLVFQEFIPGQEYDLNLFADRDGSVTTSVVLLKTALRGGLVGNAESVERVDQPDVAALGQRVVSLLGLSGPLNMDVRRRADGTPVLLEINARVGGNVPAATEVLEALLDAWVLKPKR